MNKRQKKKAFKKKHGHNPPSMKMVVSWMNTLSLTINRVIDGLKNLVNEIGEVVKSTCVAIKTMPESEFEEKLLNLTPEQQAIARKIRAGEGGKQNETD